MLRQLSIARNAYGGLWSAMHGCVWLLIAQPSFPWPDDREALIDNIG